jgi:O-antigen ligase
VFSLIALPWLNGYTAGPSAGVYPWLFTVACALLLWPLLKFLTVRQVACGWALAALLSAGMGLLQYFGLSYKFAPWVFSTPAGEAFANLRQRNQFATLTSIGLLSVLWCWSQAQGRGAKVQLALAVLILAVGNAVSSSRTGGVQWVLVAMLALLWSHPARRQVAWVAVTAVAVYAATVYLLPLILGAVTGVTSSGLLGRFAEDPGCASRSVLWANVLHLIVQRPFLGWGWGELSYAHMITLYPGQRFCDILDNAHNLPLQLAVELGVPLGALVTGALMYWVWRAKPWRETRASRQLAWGVLAVIGLHSLLEYPLWYGPFQMAVALALWLLYGQKQSAISVLAQVVRGVTATFSIAIVAYVVCDYWRVSQLYLSPAQRAPGYQADTLAKVHNSVLFKNQVLFAELTTTPLTPENAQHLHDLALQVLHYSPEAKVLQKLIESCVMLGQDEETKFYLLRYQLGFPEAHAVWMQKL